MFPLQYNLNLDLFVILSDLIYFLEEWVTSWRVVGCVRLASWPPTSASWPPASALAPPGRLLALPDLLLAPPAHADPPVTSPTPFQISFHSSSRRDGAASSKSVPVTVVPSYYTTSSSLKVLTQFKIHHIACDKVNNSVCYYRIVCQYWCCVPVR